ncbi:hypothetical protein RRG08_036610 [Elysia crispata]|uniref:Uncharacterized protein n=1 Tax=Elysia crispata TaxID=231223 RepID=A0AAE0ZR50_9GAST|nr:hypothetical protein RRG08_036610 [Elysia crispata]
MKTLQSGKPSWLLEELKEITKSRNFCFHSHRLGEGGIQCSPLVTRGAVPTLRLSTTKRLQKSGTKIDRGQTTTGLTSGPFTNSPSQSTHSLFSHLKANLFRHFEQGKQRSNVARRLAKCEASTDIWSR